VAAYMNLKRVDQLIARHQARQEDATDRLWRLINLQLWGEVFLLGKHGRSKPLDREPLVATV
jgi:asparagine synthase (glutamine-hydrolysing)